MKSYPISKYIMIMLILIEQLLIPTGFSTTQSKNYTIILISQEQFFQPYTFEYKMNNSYQNIGFVWVRTDNKYEKICFGYYNVDNIVNSINITEDKAAGILKLPTACTINDTIYIAWIEERGSSVFDIFLRVLNPNFTLGTIIQIADDRIAEIDDYSKIDYKNIDFHIYAMNSLIYIFWNENSLEWKGRVFTHYCIYSAFNSHVSVIYPVYIDEYEASDRNSSFRAEFNPYCFDIITIYNKSTIGFVDATWGADPTQKFIVYTINQSNPFIINCSDYSNERLEKYIYYHYDGGMLPAPSIREESIRMICDGEKLYINYPVPAIQFGQMQKDSDQWLLRRINLTDRKNEDIILMTNTSFITKSTFYLWNQQLHFAYIDNSSTTNEELKYFSYNEEGRIDIKVVADSFICDYQQFQETWESKCYLTFHSIKNYQKDILCCVFLCRDYLNGSYQLKLTIIDSKPNVNCYLKSFNDRVYTYENVTYYATTTGGLQYEYFFDFGDGQDSGWIQEPFAIYNYNDNGTYKAGLKIRYDQSIESEWNYSYQTILNRPPIIKIEATTNYTHINKVITFSSCGTYDPDGVIISYYWDFGDGTTNNSQEVEHSFSSLKTYEVILTVMDNDQDLRNATILVNIVNTIPFADFSISQNRGNIYTNFYFHSICNDPDGNITKYTWDFGDNESSNLENPSHQYTQKGEFFVELYVIDNNGDQSNIIRRTITIENIPPSSTILPSTNNSDTLEIINIEANALDPDGYILVYLWDFGDGTTAYGYNVSHEYEDDGFYNVTFRAVDNDFANNISTIQIIIRNRPPLAVASLKSCAQTDEHVILNASGSSDRDGRIISWRWSIDSKILDGEQVDWSFQNPGKHIVKLIVTDDDGAFAERTYEILILKANTNTEINNWMLLAILIIIGIIITGIWNRLHKSKMSKTR